MSGISQDWEPVVIRKKAPTAAARKDEKAVNAARRAGAEIETVRKCKFFSILCAIAYCFFGEILLYCSVRVFLFIIGWMCMCVRRKLTELFRRFFFIVSFSIFICLYYVHIR